MNILIGNLLIGVAGVLGLVINAYNFLVLGRVIISWVNPDPYNPIVRFLYSATEPALRKIRRWIPSIGQLDLGPLILLLVLFFINAAVVQSLADFGLRLKLAG